MLALVAGIHVFIPFCAFAIEDVDGPGFRREEGASCRSPSNDGAKKFRAPKISRAENR